jgi:hypothetical protein
VETERFTARRRRVLSDLSDILIPPGGDPPPSAVDAGVPETIESWWQSFPRRERRRVNILISAFDFGPVTSFKFRRRFHKLSSQKKERWVAAAQRSPKFRKRMPLGYLKQFVFLAYASSPEVEARLGYDYTCRLDAHEHGRPKPRPAESPT